MTYQECMRVLWRRLKEPAPGRIQLLSGPRQVGKTTLLLELAERAGESAVYAAADSPQAVLPGFWERLWADVEAKAVTGKRAVLLFDEAHLLPDWSARLKGEWDRLRRRNLPVQVVATGSSALRLGAGARESLAGRFERLVLGHWPARALCDVFGLSGRDAADEVVKRGSYPGAFDLRDDPVRWSAYVLNSIVEPAIGRDLLATAPVRKPALLRQVFAVCVSCPAQIVSLQKIQGALESKGALETIAHYLDLLEEAFLVSPVQKFARRPPRGRAAPPKLIALNNALLAVGDPRGIPDQEREPARFGAWVENACLAHCLNSGQSLRYWRENGLEVDAITEGEWGAWAIEVKTGRVDTADLMGVLEFTKRNPKYRPLLVCGPTGKTVADRAGLPWALWQDFLLDGPPKGRRGTDPVADQPGNENCSQR